MDTIASLKGKREAEYGECRKVAERSQKYPLASLANGWFFRAAAAEVKPGVVRAQTFSFPLKGSQSLEQEDPSPCSFEQVLILHFMASLRGFLLSNQQKS